MIESYYNHLEKNPESLLVRIYGLFSIKTNIFGPLSVIIMQNTV
mgnify:CR=1 FL=1